MERRRKSISLQQAKIMPGQFEGILDKLQTKLGKQTIKRASTINRPRPKREVQQINIFNEFNRRNPKADGGSVNGSYEAALRKKIEELMDDGYEFGEAVREAMRQGYAKAGLVDPDNNVKKGQELGKNITQQIDYKRNKVRGYEVGIGGGKAIKADKDRKLKKEENKAKESAKKQVKK